MANENRTSEKPKYSTSFGCFIPSAIWSGGFQSREDALRVQQDLMTGRV